MRGTDRRWMYATPDMARVFAMLSRRLLDGDRPQDRRDVQIVFDKAPGYSQIVTGRPPSPAAADDTFNTRPPGIDTSDKHVFGFYLDAEIVGVADLIRGYPAPGIAWLGLLLIIEMRQNQSLGSLALEHVMKTVRDWECRTIRRGVIETNTRALAFWERQGFRWCDSKAIDGFTGRALIMERAANPPTERHGYRAR